MNYSASIRLTRKQEGRRAGEGQRLRETDEGTKREGEKRSEMRWKRMQIETRDGESEGESEGGREGGKE